MSKINKILNNISVNEDVPPTLVDQTKLLKSYKGIVDQVNQLKSYSDLLLKYFPTQTEMIKGNVSNDIGKFLFMATKNNTAKIIDINTINNELTNIIDSITSLDNLIDRQCDNMGH